MVCLLESFPIIVTLLLLDDHGQQKQRTEICGLAAQHFSIPRLHQWQMNAILATMHGRDSIVVQ